MTNKRKGDGTKLSEENKESAVSAPFSGVPSELCCLVCLKIKCLDICRIQTFMLWSSL